MRTKKILGGLLMAVMAALPLQAQDDTMAPAVVV